MKRLIVLAIVLVFCLLVLAHAGDTIPKLFKGDDIAAVVKTLENAVYANNKMNYIGNKEDVDRVYTFKISDDVVISGHAGVWIERTIKNIWPRYLEGEGPYYLVKSMGAPKTNWTGQNVFGARTRVEVETETKYFIISERDIRKLPVKPIGGKIGVLFIGKPREADNGGSLISRSGYVAFVGQGSQPTFDMPYQTVRKYYGLRLKLKEVVVYDQESGQVLLKYKP
jgi:hypothetical protein